MLDGTPESPQDYWHKMKRTLLSPQECKIAPCQLEMKPIIPSLAPELSGVPYHAEQVASLPFGNYRDSLRHQSQVYMNISFSTATGGKLHETHIIPR